MGTNCAGCGDPVPAPSGMRGEVEVRLLDDGRHQWGLPGFYGTVIHRCATAAA